MAKSDIKYIDLSKPRRTLSPLNFGEDIIYPAHTQSIPESVAYVPKRELQSLIDENEKLKEVIKALRAIKVNRTATHRNP